MHSFQSCTDDSFKPISLTTGSPEIGSSKIKSGKANMYFFQIFTLIEICNTYFYSIVLSPQYPLDYIRLHAIKVPSQTIVIIAIIQLSSTLPLVYFLVGA